MRYDVQQQIDDIDKALFILELREMPNMKQPTEEELETALKKARSCMKLVIREIIRQDKTMKEMYHNINQWVGNSLDAPAYAEKILTECGKEILEIVENYDKG